MAETPPPSSRWSDIPLDLAGLVLRRLPAHADRVRFAAVCPQWRLAARDDGPLPPPLPLLAIPDGTVSSLPGSAPLRFAGFAGFVVDACGSWLAFSGEDGGCFLRNPFTNATVTLPRRFRPRPLRAGDDDETTAIGFGRKDLTDNLKRLSIQNLQLSIHKLMFCSPQLVAALVRFQTTALIAVCRPGAASSWWSVDLHSFSPSVDMAFHQGKLYVLDDRTGSLLAIDISLDQRTGDPWVSRLQSAISVLRSITLTLGESLAMKKLYLVEQLHGGGLLLMVRRVRRKMYCRLMGGAGADRRYSIVPFGHEEFAVFRADLQQARWSKVTTIGDDQVLFLRGRCSGFVRVSGEEMEMLGDRIVFLDKDGEGCGWYEEESSDSLRVYDMRDGKVSAFAPAVSVPATWLFPRS